MTREEMVMEAVKNPGLIFNRIGDPSNKYRWNKDPYRLEYLSSGGSWQPSGQISGIPDVEFERANAISDDVVAGLRALKSSAGVCTNAYNAVEIIVAALERKIEEISKK